MSDKLMTIAVRGETKEWLFKFYADPKHLEEWAEDGLEVGLVENIIPDWIPAFIEPIWCFFQDVFNFRNPWRKS